MTNTLGSPSSLLSTPHLKPNLKSEPQGTPTDAALTGQPSRRKQRWSEGPRRQLAQQTRASCKNGRPQNDHKSPPFQVHLCNDFAALLIQRWSLFSHLKSDLGHNHCDTNKSLKDIYAVGVFPLLLCLEPWDQCADEPKLSQKKGDLMEEEPSAPVKAAKCQSCAWGYPRWSRTSQVTADQMHESSAGSAG